MKGSLPTFVVAGAPRCGTTSLHYYLRQHPQICMSAIKEPNFFLFGPDGAPHVAEEPIIRKSVRRLDEYEALFHPSATTVAVGDVSPLYLYTRPSAGRILETCGAIRIICLVRPPAERAWSHFLYAFSDVPAEERAQRFANLVDAELAGGTGYEPYRTRTHLVRLGRYDDQVAHYQETFGADNVLVVLTDDLDRDAPRVLRDICSFIGVSPDQQLELDRHYNTTGGGSPAGWSMLRRVVRRVQPALKAALPPRLAGRLAEMRASRLDAGREPAPPVPADVAARITAWCADDVRALATRTGLDLSSWLRS